MKQRHPRSWLRALSALALGATNSARTADASSAAKQAATPKEEPVVLSPFEVSPESERGYQSTAVLQGGRGRIDLADVAGQVAVFTKEFLDDIAATTTDEAYLFSATTQTYYDNVNGNGDSRPGSRNIADDAGNAHGLGNLDKTRNYFRTSIDSDSYNTERFSLPAACPEHRRGKRRRWRGHRGPDAVAARTRAPVECESRRLLAL